MSKGSVLSTLGAVALGAALLSLLAIGLAAPALWLRWETDGAETQARGLVSTASENVQTGLKDLLSRFERATASIHPNDISSDPIVLTARLLRFETLVAPAFELSVLNERGEQVATSATMLPNGLTTVWWFAQAPSSGASAAVLGCGLKASLVEGWILARGVEGPGTGIRGWIGSSLAPAALEAVASPLVGSGVIRYRLLDTDGCELLAGGATDRPRAPVRSLLSVYSSLLPQSWVVPQPVSSTVRVGNLNWTAVVSSEFVIALRSASVKGVASTVFYLSATLCGLAALASAAAISAALRHRRKLREVAQTPGSATTSAEIRRQLEEIAGERDRVLAAIGHDVRTPINSILGICSLLMDGDMEESQRKWVQRIRASCQALLAMLTGMLEIAAARMDGAAISRECVDVAGLIDEVGEVLRPQAEDKGLELRITIDASVVGTWGTDPTRLRQVLFNLGGNALKYTARGYVEIGASVEKTGDQSLLYLCVTDTGPGIAADERDVIFEQFRRGRNGISGGYEGLGLGLALCREIATLLGGSLTVESPNAAGSVFTFSIPVKSADTVAPRGGKLAGRTALVVGLSEGMRRRVASHLKSIGFSVQTAAEGFVAAGLAERTAFQHGTLDLVILDAGLDGLTAEALLARLKASKRLEHLKSVLVAHGPLSATAKSMVDAVVSHPVENSDLDRTTNDFFGTRSILQEVDSRAPSAPRPRVLVVEDNRINQALFVDQLDRAGFSTFAASNGGEAVEAVLRGGFDGVLMDVQMPDVGGIEATRRIRLGDCKIYRIPIIGMTAHVSPIVRQNCLDAGMDAVMHKPLDFGVLPMRLREAIISARAGQQCEEARVKGSSSIDDNNLNDKYLKALLQDFGPERGLSCVKAFLTETTVHVAEMSHQLRDGSWEDLERLAHSLAGISGALGAVAFADALLLLEIQAQAGHSTPTTEAFQNVLTIWERTRVELPRRFDDLRKEHVYEDQAA